MAKLKFDRSINVKIIKGETVTVPADEVWKVTGHPPNEIQINGRVLTHLNELTIPFIYTLGGGINIGSTNDITITGVAFKVIKEE